MERVLTTEQMRSADRYTIDVLGVDENTLVQRAGDAVAQEIIKRFLGGRVLVCVGNGNNGADGRVVAEILCKTHGFSVSVLNVSTGMFKLFDKKYDIIVDCIFGTGLNRIVEGKYRKVIENINDSDAYVISCDIPSGINGDNGKVMGVAVKANLTIAIQELKLGHFLGEGIEYSGNVIAKDIGISIWEDGVANRLTNTSVSKYFQTKPRNVHKGSFGKSAIIGGSKDFSGSIILSKNALTAMKTGVGYSAVGVPESIFPYLVGTNPECILISIKDNGNVMVLDIESLDKFLDYDCISVGMGLGTTEHGYQIVKYLLENFNGVLVIDADGLNCLAKYGLEILKNKKCRVVLTPHIGEFSRLTGIEKGKIIENPIEIAKDFAKEFDCVVLLKNAVSIITNGEQTIINTTGCSGLAKAGSGDVLSGVLCGVLPRCEDLTLGVAVGAYVFGKAGEYATAKQNEYTVTASDVINELTTVINEFR